MSVVYRIKKGSSVIYDSSDKDTYPVSKPTGKLGVNDAGSCEFTLMPEHPMYSQMAQMKSFITVYEDNEEIFYGRVLNADKDLYGGLTVHCEGAFTFFLDSEQEKGTYTETISAFITRVITAHNSQVEVDKQFTVGNITADKAVEIDPKTGQTVKIEFSIQDYSPTKSVLESLITGKYGGFFRIRPNPNGPHFLDYVQNYGRTNTQLIKIGDNVVSKTDHISGENIFTILRPLGKNNLTIENLTQQDVTLQNVVKDGTKLKMTNMITQYGNILRTERFSEIDKAEDLLKAAEEFITRRGTMLPSTCSINYVDWHLWNPTVMGVRVGDQFTTIEGFSGATMTVAELDLDFEDPSKNEMTLYNTEELNSHDPASSSGSLSASYASRCQHIDYVYKYIREEDNLLLLSTQEIQVVADQLKLVGRQTLILAQPDETHPGEIKLAVGDSITNPEGATIVVTLDNVAINSGAGGNGNLTVEGYVTAAELQAEFAEFDAALASGIVTEALQADDAYITRLNIAGFSAPWDSETVVTAVDFANQTVTTAPILYLGRHQSA